MATTTKRSTQKWEDLADRIWKGDCENCERHSDDIVGGYLIDGLCDKCHKNPFLFGSNSMNNCHPIIRKFGQWAVTTFGVECIERGSPYSIEQKRVHEPSWECHMREKDWVSMGDFTQALAYARKQR